MPIDPVKIRNAVLLVPAMVALQFSLKAGAAREILADPPVLRGTVNLAIGGANEDRTEYEFGQISGLTFDAGGRIFMADAGESKVRVYSAKGEHLLSIGQKGRGPGDFASLANIAVASDGTLWVQEFGNQRLSVMRAEAPHGRYLRSIAFKSNSQTLDAVHWDAAGHVVVIGAAATRPGEPMRTVRSFVDAKGGVAATDTAPPVSPDSTEHWIIPSNGGVANYSKPFGMMRTAAFGGAGMAAYATNTNYAVRLVDAQGKQVALLRRALPPVALSARERNQSDALREHIAKDLKVAVATLKLEMPSTKPVIASLGFDMDGRLWVERAVPDGTAREADVYDRTGTWVAVMQWPAGVALAHHAVKGTTGVGVAMDADGVQQVVRLAWK